MCGGGCGLQALNRARLFRARIDERLVQNARRAVQSAANCLAALVRAGFLNHAGQAGVDDRGGSAGLFDQKVSNQFNHSIRARMMPTAGRRPELACSVQIGAKPCQPVTCLSKTICSNCSNCGTGWVRHAAATPCRGCRRLRQRHRALLQHLKTEGWEAELRPRLRAALGEQISGPRRRRLARGLARAQRPGQSRRARRTFSQPPLLRRINPHHEHREH